VSTAELKATMACSFCLKSPGQVDKMVAGPGVFICNECIGLCNDILAQEGAKKSESTDYSVATWQQRLSDEELLSTMPKIQAAAAQIQQHLTAWVRQARERGITWTRIGEALGMTRQSAWERFSGEE
jgi:ClpX C4-type zinc finger